MKFSLAAGEIEVWTMRFETAPPADLAILSRDERQRALGFRFEADRSRFAQSRLFVRYVLCGYLDLDPREVRFIAGPQGKPALAAGNPVSLAFNLSHCRSRAILAVATTGRIGIDAEDPTSFDDLEQLIHSAFAPDQAAAILALPDHDILPSFLRGWTRKEAVLKAIGTGFGIEPRTVRVPFSADGLWRIHVPGDPAILDLIDISHAGVVAALATDSPPAMLRLREFDLDAQP